MKGVTVSNFGGTGTILTFSFIMYSVYHQTVAKHVDFVLIIDHEKTHLPYQIIKLQVFQNEMKPKRVNLNGVQSKRESFMDA